MLLTLNKETFMTRHAGLEPSPNMGWPILIAKLILNTWSIKFVNTRPRGFIVYNLDSSSYKTLQTFSGDKK